MSNTSGFANGGPCVCYLRIRKLRDETLIEYFEGGRHRIGRIAAAGAGEALFSAGTAASRSGLKPAGSGARQEAVPAVAPITEDEFEELAGLRKAQCWCTPVFQPDHPDYGRAMTRLKQLEAKERRACGQGEQEAGERSGAFAKEQRSLGETRGSTVATCVS